MKKLLIFLLLFLVPFNIKGLETSATSAILMDQDSGRILYSKDIHNVRSVASISKIMTAVVALESGKLKDKIEIGNEIEDAYGSGIYIKQGEHLTLEDLLYGLMLRSGNDAALAIAKYVGGSVDNFVNLMNKKAKEIGMKDSIFNNPSGLDKNKGNYSTAYDMALLVSYAMKNEEYRKIVGTKKYKLKTDMNIYSWANKNKLLFNYKYTTGGKTGFTDIARRTLVTTASKDNLNLAAVTLNDGNDFTDHENMFEYGFNNYTSYQLLKAGNINIDLENYYENKEFYINNDFYYALGNNETESVLLKFNIEKNHNVKDFEKIGSVEVYVNEEKIKEEDVYIRSIKQNKKSFLKKIIDWFKNIW